MLKYLLNVTLPRLRKSPDAKVVRAMQDAKVLKGFKHYDDAVSVMAPMFDQKTWDKLNPGDPCKSSVFEAKHREVAARS